MRTFFYILSAMAVIGLAFWAYSENYKTKDAQTRAASLQRDVSKTRQRLRVLKAEWAYLNRPERLRELAELNYEKLGLQPLQPIQFGRIDQVAFPPAPELIKITDTVDISHMEPMP